MRQSMKKIFDFLYDNSIFTTIICSITIILMVFAFSKTTDWIAGTVRYPVSKEYYCTDSGELIYICCSDGNEVTIYSYEGAEIYHNEGVKEVDPRDGVRIYFENGSMECLELY